MDGMGEKKNFMYHYIEDKEFLKRMKSFCSGIINQLVQRINNDSIMTVEAYLVGSGAKNLITQNANEPIELDYNLCVNKIYVFRFNNPMEIKEYIKKHFNVVLKNNGWSDCQDSTSALSTNKIYFTKGNKTKFDIDLAIVRENNRGWERLIHNKTGIVVLDQWYWNETPNARDLVNKACDIKDSNLWKKVREFYLDKKNMYLRRGDREDPSFILYIETINEIYSKHLLYKR